jgi:hypothetical protein
MAARQEKQQLYLAVVFKAPISNYRVQKVAKTRFFGYVENGYRQINTADH